MSSKNSSQFSGDNEDKETGETTERENSTSENHQPSDETPKKRRYRQSKKDELFDYQPTGTESLPPAKEFVTGFVPKVLETIHGLREVRSLGKQMTHTVYAAIEARAAGVKLRNQVAKEPPPRPVFALGNVVISEPRDGVCEAAAVVHGPTRVRAVALRIEGLDNRWKATSFRML
jgi:hypothetical protein